MSTLPTSKDRLRVLLSNDDGPPGKDSPYILSFAHHLSELGWDIKVVIPSSQKSWIGKAYQIKEITKGRYFYPKYPDGTGELSTSSRPVRREEGEFGEWILLDGTPATCVNIALHNIYKGEIDMVISGPNFGRNSSSAFSLSSGTIGAALSSSLSQIRSIALSYGTVQNPVPATLHEPAHILAIRIIRCLVDNWGKDEVGIRNGEVDLYSINIPMVNDLLKENSVPVVWTTIWRNKYGQLFKPHTLAPSGTATPAPEGGPDAVVGDAKRLKPGENLNSLQDTKGDSAPELIFKFAPSMEGLIGPNIAAPVGTDAWAVDHGLASITPLRASFAETPHPYIGDDGQSPVPFEM